MALERLAHTRLLRTEAFALSVRQVLASRRVAAVALKAFGESRAGAAVGADLGGSSKYSSENLED